MVSPFTFILKKYLAAAKRIVNSPIFARDPRKVQFEADINLLFLYTCYKRLGEEAEKADVDEIIKIACQSSINDLQKQVQENIHSQITKFCKCMDTILLPDHTWKWGSDSDHSHSINAHKRSGFSYMGHKPDLSLIFYPDEAKTLPLKQVEASQRLKDISGFTLEARPSLIRHKEAGQGLFIDGKADIGTVIAFYPGIIYSPSYYKYIPGYPIIDVNNPYLITRYDGSIINARSWGSGGETRGPWPGHEILNLDHCGERKQPVSYKLWRLLRGPIDASHVNVPRDVLERRNPLALGHFANHPAKGMKPNVMICPYDFPLHEASMRPYIPNVCFGGREMSMRRFGMFWVKTRSAGCEEDAPVLKALVLVAAKPLCDEEVLLNYRLSNTRYRPSWYIPVDKEEDERRWG